MPMPARNNLKSVRLWLKRICVWIAQKRSVYVEWLTPAQVAAIDALVVACEGVIAVIDEIYPPDA